MTVGINPPILTLKSTYIMLKMNPFRTTLETLTHGLTSGIGLLVMGFLVIATFIGFRERLLPLVVVSLLLEITLGAMFLVK